MNQIIVRIGETHYPTEVVLQRLLEFLPKDQCVIESVDEQSMGKAEVLVLIASHLIVGGMIEGAKVVWDEYQTPLVITLPQGEEIICRGSSEVLNSIKEIAKQFENAKKPD